MPVVGPGPDHDAAGEAAGQYQSEEYSTYQAHGNPHSITFVRFLTACTLRSCASQARARGPARSFPPRMQASLLVFALHNSKLEGYQESEMKPGAPI